ncbi:MAG: glycoside hydrolase family 15 protein [Planctomycetota bacterium]
MPRDIPVGNGDLLLTFDDRYRIRDLYYPRVGRFNHTLGNVQRFGLWIDGSFAWIEDPGWTRVMGYERDTLVTSVTLRHEGLGVEIRCRDGVDFHEPVYFRRSEVQDLTGRDRDARLFFHVDLSIGEQAVGNTANYDPQTSSVVLYKDDFYFLINACDERKCGIDHWAIGSKGLAGKEGTWKDAEDGELQRNVISQGSVDACVGFNLRLPASGSTYVTSWIACGRSYGQVRARSNSIWAHGPDRMLSRTGAYWKLWVSKEQTDTSGLPPRFADLFARSQLIVRTQIDNGGAIIAANDTDITHFAGDHYSYCWMRDGALVADGLIRAGQSELSRQFFRYAARCVESEGYFLHKHTPEGHLGSSWHPWVTEGRRVLPIQEDETALVVWALRRHFEVFRDVEFVKPLYRPLVTQTADWMCGFRDKRGLPLPSWDLWEERYGIHTFTVSSVIGALEAAAEFASDFGESDRMDNYQRVAREMREAMLEHLFDRESGRFARMAEPEGETYRLDMTSDSANFAVWAFGGLDPTSEEARSEMEGLNQDLLVRTDVGGYARYQRDYYHQVESEKTDVVPGNPWVICTLWRAWWLIESASTTEELARADELMNWCADRAHVSGVLAEQFDPYSGDPISVSPLTWSHATVVTVAMAYIKKLEALSG